MATKYFFFVLTIAAVALEAAGDIFFKKWVGAHRASFLIIGLLVYFFGTVFWALSLRYELLSKAISIFTILNLIVIVLVGTLVFSEHLTTLNKLGIALGVVSIILLEL